VRYHVVACDYDGTLALHGRVDAPTVAALDRLRLSGRRLMMVTGRQLRDLLEVCDCIDRFEVVVAENGALLYWPARREEKLLTDPAAEALAERLQARHVTPLSVGRGIIATWEPHQGAVLETIREMGLELHVIFNKGAVMVLPSGVNKASGLKAALWEMGVSAHNVVAIGDAENDHALLCAAECGVAVANALPSLKQNVDLVTSGDHGAGVAEVVDRLLENDLADVALHRHRLPLGVQADGADVRLSPYGVNVLVAGSSGSGKSTFATAFLERLYENGYQFAVIDPEGDYERLEAAVVLGDSRRCAGVDEVLTALERPGRSVVVNLLALPLEHRPAFFDALLPQVQRLRAQTGRPHWLMVDETHHLLPTTWDPGGLTLPQEMHGMMFITVHPDHVSQAVLASVDLIVAVGGEAVETLATFARALGHPPPPETPRPEGRGQVLGWRPGEERAFWFTAPRPHWERRRHLRKYAEGDLGPDRSFYFRGADGRLNLRAQNLALFLQIAEGIDDETWLHHLRTGDYAGWFRDKVKDDALAAEAERIARGDGVDARHSRRLIAEAIRQRYTIPA
jgi:HAD superfamily hydrolase (TIGR01484 family)